MKVAVCFDGIEDGALAEAASPFLHGYSAVEAWCAYGEAAERLLEHVAERHHHAPPPPPPGPHHPSLDAEQAASIAAHGVALLQRLGIPASPQTLGGRDPGHALADASDPGVLLVLAAGHGDRVAPRSVGHVARFVVDHARGPTLLLRLKKPS
ncbi:MAG TPA: hypothetical protein VIN40_02565 [Candidatus Tyrphobacter sp.]